MFSVFKFASTSMFRCVAEDGVDRTICALGDLTLLFSESKLPVK